MSHVVKHDGPRCRIEVMTIIVMTINDESKIVDKRVRAQRHHSRHGEEDEGHDHNDRTTTTTTRTTTTTTRTTYHSGVGRMT